MSEEDKVKYIAKELEKVPTKPGCWDYTKIGVFEQALAEDSKTVISEKQVGEYQRNYSFNPKTFYPFKKDDKWYALYSKEYMYTRVMSLPDCTDICGEDKNNIPYNNHFCPLAYYVPLLCVQDFKKGEVDPWVPLPNHDFKKWCKNGKYPDSKGSTHTEEEKKEYKELYEKQHALSKARNERHPFVYKYAEFGFVAGCFFGDDSSSKLEVLDLRDIDKGTLKRNANFGYFELPENCSLENCIDDKWIEGEEIYDWSKVKLSIAKPVTVQLDGSYDNWYLKEKFEKLKIKYSNYSKLDFNKVEEIFNIFCASGLDSDILINKMEELLTTILKAKPLPHFLDNILKLKL